MKKILSVMAVLVLTAALFAQNAKSTGLTDSDVKNWIKNCVTIENEFSKLGLDSQDTASYSVKEKNQAESVLQKNGISGPNSIEKYAMIVQSAAVIKAESELDAEAKAMIKMLGIDPLAELKRNVNDADYKIVSANSKAVLKAVDTLDANEPPSSEDSDENSEYMEQLMNANSNYVASLIQPQIDEENAIYEPVKRFYEALSKSKGDCGLIYKDQDNKRTSDYAKAKNKNSTLNFNLNYEEAEIKCNFDFKKNTAVFTINWKESSFDQKAADLKKTTDIKKTVKFNIKSVEFYEAGREGYTDLRCEYAITTKEGNVIHLWQMESFDGNAFSSRLNFNGMPEEFNDCDVYYED